MDARLRPRVRQKRPAGAFLELRAVFLFRIRIEEQALVKHFGEDYIRYRERTKRLIPSIN